MTTLSIIPIAVAAYIATNLDNFTLLVSLLSRYGTRTASVSLGYVSSMFVILGMSFWIGLAGDKLPVEFLGFLGIIPLGIGLVGVWRLIRKTTAGPSGSIDNIDNAKTVFFASFFTQVANGADTVVTISILFADSTPAVDAAIFVTLATFVAVFLGTAIYAVRHPAISNIVDRYANRITPFLLIFVGLYVILNTATDLMPDT